MARPNLVCQLPILYRSLPLSGLELRPRSATEIVDAAFQLYRQQFAALVMLSAVIFTPYILLELLLTGGQSSSTTVEPVAMVVLFGTAWVFSSLSEAAIVMAVSNSYLRGEPDPADSLRRTARRLAAVMVAILAKWLAIGLGLGFGLATGVVGAGLLTAFVALLNLGSASVIVVTVLAAGALVLGIWFAYHVFARYFAIPATVVLEGVGVRAALRRSSALSQGYKGKIFGALALPMLLFFAIQFVMMATLELLPGPRYLSSLGWQIINVVISPILSVIATLLYYDARIRKEGFDIQVMAAELGAASADAQLPPVPSH